MTTRRQLLIAMSAALAAARPSHAQQMARVWRVGFLTRGSRPADGGVPASLRQGLAELGYVEDRNIAYEGRWDMSREKLRGMADDLVRLRVDAIVTRGEAPAAAAKAATSTIPILLAGAADPVGSGLVASLARPGGNVTGNSVQATELSAKRLEILREAVPKASRIAVLWNAKSQEMMVRYREIDRAAGLLRLVIQPLGVGEPDDFDVAFSAMTRDRPDALFLVTDALTNLNRKRVIDFAAKHRIPAMYEFDFLVEDGGLMAYGPSLDAVYRQLAIYIDKIFKGAKPSEMPVEQLNKFYLHINLKTAKSLGIVIPPSLLLRADKVIE